MQYELLSCVANVGEAVESESHANTIINGSNIFFGFTLSCVLQLGEAVKSESLAETISKSSATCLIIAATMQHKVQDNL